MSAPPVIEAVGATKRFKEVLGLNGFTASFGPGITGLIGPNGAGKSTFFNVLTGQLHLDAGELRFLGQSTWNTPAKNRDLGYCPDHSGMPSWMTPEAWVVSLLEMDGYLPAEARDRARRSLETVHLTEVSHRPLRTFSKGMRQRAKVAQAIAHDPKVLLLDEPLNGADPIGRVRLLELFREMAAKGRHIVVSSHVLHEVERLTSQIVMIANGRALAQGDLHKIRDLLDMFPHTIELETSTPRPLAKVLSDRVDVMNLKFTGPDRLAVQTSSPDAFYRDLADIALTEGLSVTGVRSLDDNLEAVFRFLGGR